ncbi:MAG: aldo/keto reductase [Myxococcota bacterium]
MRKKEVSAPRTRRLPGWALAALWGLTFGAAYAGAGHWLSQRVEGLDPGRIARVPALLALLTLLVSLSATVAWARGGPRGSADSSLRAGRRRFLLGALGGLGGLVGTVAAVLLRVRGWLTVTGPNIVTAVPTHAPQPRGTWRGSRIRSYRRLGRTGERVSDISLGTGRIRLDNAGEAIAREAIERGVNYFDTAPDYSGFGSELAMGRAMQGRRDEMFLATKFCTAHGHLNVGASVHDHMAALEGSLQRLQTDHVDLVHIHSCDSVERLLDENTHEAFDRLREQGKVRFLGVSTHTPNLEAVANTAIDSGRFDVLMLAYHHGAWPGLAALIDRAAAQDVGIVAMKTLKGAKHHGLLELRDEADSFPQAAFKWVLSNPSVSCLVVSFFEHRHVDEYLYASGRAPTAEDRALLQRYDEAIAGKHCFAHCGACLSHCPEGLPIHDVLRYRMYFEDYRDEKEAMRLYARLAKGAEVCVGCPAPCQGRCPHGVPIRERMMGAHRMLQLG